MKRRIACLFFALFLFAAFLTGCEERQIYPLSEVREEDWLNHKTCGIWGCGHSPSGWHRIA